jgi:hypothetical protein
MRSGKVGLAALGLAFALAGPSIGLAQPYWVELDLDGTVENGPDTLLVATGDTVNVDVWVRGSGGEWDYIELVQVTLCNPDGALEYLGWTLGGDVAWCLGTHPWSNQDEECVTMRGDGSFHFCGIPAPFLFAEVMFRVAGEEGFGEVTVDLARSGWWFGSEGYFVDGIGGVVEIRPTSAERSSWTSVKALFR